MYRRPLPLLILFTHRNFIRAAVIPANKNPFSEKIYNAPPLCYNGAFGLFPAYTEEPGKTVDIFAKKCYHNIYCLFDQRNWRI